MNGLGNRFSGVQEKQEVARAQKNFERRVVETGKIPGTHSLGAEFRTVVKRG